MQTKSDRHRMSPKVLYDHQAFQMQSRGGISRYFAELASGLQQLGVITPEIAPGVHCSEVISELEGRIPFVGPVKKLPIFPKSYFLRRVLNPLIFEWNVLRSKPDIWHPTYFRTFSLCHKGKIALTIYDLIHERFGHLISRNDRTVVWRKSAIPRASVIFAISEATKKDIVELYRVPAEKIIVTHLANSLKRGTLPTHREKKPYILFVGPRENYKNFSIVKNAFLESKAIRSKYLLLCVGGEPAPRRGEDEEVGILYHTKVDDDKLASFYAGAYALVYPSMYEGFGLPLLEAMSMGCPVITSGEGSLREVGSDAALYFNANSVPELVQAIQRLESSIEREEFIRRGIDREKEFSWSRCSKRTCDGYLDALGLKRGQH